MTDMHMHRDVRWTPGALGYALGEDPVREDTSVRRRQCTQLCEQQP
jgi:hypothetical protein